MSNASLKVVLSVEMAQISVLNVKMVCSMMPQLLPVFLVQVYMPNVQNVVIYLIILPFAINVRIMEALIILLNLIKMIKILDVIPHAQIIMVPNLMMALQVLVHVINVLKPNVKSVFIMDQLNKHNVRLVLIIGSSIMVFVSNVLLIAQNVMIKRFARDVMMV